MTANPELRGVVVTGGNVLPQRVIEDAFRAQYGRTLNFDAFRNAIRRLNGWYDDRELYGQARSRPLIRAFFGSMVSYACISAVHDFDHEPLRVILCSMSSRRSCMTYYIICSSLPVNVFELGTMWRLFVV